MYTVHTVYNEKIISLIHFVFYLPKKGAGADPKKLAPAPALVFNRCHCIHSYPASILLKYWRNGCNQRKSEANFRQTRSDQIQNPLIPIMTYLKPK